MIGARAFPESPFKGFEFFVEALQRLEPDVSPLAIVTTHGKGHLNEFIGRHQIIDLGWTNDGLYLGFTVYDNDIEAAPASGWWWARDSVEFFIATRPPFAKEWDKMVGLK